MGEWQCTVIIVTVTTRSKFMGMSLNLIGPAWVVISGKSKVFRNCYSCIAPGIFARVLCDACNLDVTLYMRSHKDVISQINVQKKTMDLWSQDINKCSNLISICRV